MTGEEVGAEHEPETVAVKAHVSVGVPRQMDGAQAVPHIDEVPIVEPAVRNEWLEGRKKSAKRLQVPSDSCPATVVRTTRIVLGVETGRRNPRAGLACNCGHVEDVVEVPVGDDDTTNALALPAASAKRVSQKKSATDESSVEQI